MTKKPVSRIGMLVVVAAFAGALAIPSSAAAARPPKCGNVFGPGIGAKVRAENIKCGNALRYMNACISKGKLEPGWTARLREDKGRLKLLKNDKKIVGLLEGGITDNLRECVEASPSG